APVRWEVLRLDVEVDVSVLGFSRYFLQSFERDGRGATQFGQGLEVHVPVVSRFAELHREDVRAFAERDEHALMLMRSGLAERAVGVRCTWRAGELNSCAREISIGGRAWRAQYVFGQGRGWTSLHDDDVPGCVRIRDR